ncbi:MAG: hypothetical protein INQ03_06020 [Candidatus Heimdallarchaeota archaeon]|nr:hypothetical protein [Candidatus Heimdallarchaeota archaeon]
MRKLESLSDKGFLKLPSLENIRIKPNDPYSLPTEGVIHAHKFIKILNYLLHQGDWHDLLEDLSGHQMISKIKEYEKSSLADLCRHILYVNKNKIGWESFDNLLVELDNQHYIPRWELPNTSLYNDMINEIYTTIVELMLDVKEEKIFLEIISGFEDLGIFQLNLREKLNSKFKIWNYKDLIQLYDLLLDDKVNEYFKKRSTPIHTIINKIALLFIETIENPRTTNYQRIGLAVLFIKIYVKQGNKALIKSQELIDTIWKLVDKLNPQEKISFRTLLGATFSYLIYQIFVTQSDFITRRKILGRIISNFINLKDFDIDKWFLSLTSIHLRHEIINYILQGYTRFVYCLKYHINELPEGSIRENLIDLAENIVFNVKSTLFDYIYKYLGMQHIDSIEPGMWVYTFLKKDLNSLILRDTQKLIVNITELQVELGIYKKIDDDYSREISITKLILELSASEQELAIFEMKANLMLDTYSFETIKLKIIEEFNEFDGIILSPTFENEIIGFLSRKMDFLLKTNLDSDYRRNGHEFLIYFIAEWLNELKDHEDIYGEALMYLSPIISVNYVQIMREYFIKNKINLAFLTYLNMNYFLEFIVYEIKRANIWKVDKESTEQKKKISNKFRSIIDEWKVEDLLNMDDIKKSVISMEISIINSNIESVSTLSGMIEDEIILGYLENIQRLEVFIAQTSDKPLTDEEIRNLSALYLPPKDDVINIFNRVGYSRHAKSGNEIPFPIIRNLNSFTVSMEMFPVTTNYIEIINNKNVFDSFVEILSLTDE